MDAEKEIQWATLDKDGEIATWSREDIARDYIANRIRWGIAKPGQEKLLSRTVSLWEETK